MSDMNDLKLFQKAEKARQNEKQFDDEKPISRALWQEYQKLLNKKGMRKIDGINTGSAKRDIIDGINCLNCSDETMNLYLSVVETAYPATAKAIKNNGNYLIHYHNRYYVYNIAHTLLKSLFNH